MDKMSKGLAQVELMNGEFGKNAVENVSRKYPELAPFVVEFGFSDVYARPGLDLKQREIATIATLTTLGDSGHQLEFHLRTGLHVGLTETEITEVLVNCIPQIGIPRVMNAFQVWEKVLEERRAAATAGSA